jgi:hypothetical protein
MCEFNMKPYKQYPDADIVPNQTLVNIFIDKFEEVNAWGWAYWLWNFRPHTNPNFNLINVTKEENIQPTQNFGYIRNAIAEPESSNQDPSDETTALARRETRAGSSDSIGSLLSSSSSPSSENASSRIEADTIFPTVNITTVTVASPIGDTVIVTGQAFDVGSDIKEVGVRVDKGGVRAEDSRFELAKPDDEKGWLLWSASVPVEGLEEGDHEVVARAVDKVNHTKRDGQL